MMNNPELFNKVNELTRVTGMKCLAEYSNKIKWRKDGASVIDVGSADGSVTCLLKKNIPCDIVKFVGGDISETMVEFASKQHSGENITFRVLDIGSDLPNDLKCGFNYVFSFYTLNCVQNQEKAFSNFYDLLTKDGDCFHVIAQNVPIYDMVSRVAEDAKWGSTWLKDLNKFLSPYYNIQEPELKVIRIMEKIGFVNIHVERKRLSYTLNNWLELKNFVKSILPFNIPDDVFEELAADCVSIAQDMGLLDKNTIDFEEKPIEYNYHVLVVHANKP